MGGPMDHNGMIRGKWELPGTGGGPFELKMDSPFWTGHYNQFGQSHPMQLGLCISGHQVYGNGCDDVGMFGIHGTYDQHNGHMQFTKHYFGQHSLVYKGEHHKGHGHKDKIQGQWQGPGCGWDTFELTLHN